MRSQTIKVRNLPAWQSPPRTIHVKPVLGLILAGITGFVLLFFSGVAGLGVFLILISVFSMLMMPDRFLVQYTPEYLILYNHREIDLCTIIYWDEIVNWQYEYHPAVDVFTIHLINGSSESIELYGKWTVERYMNQFAPGKEIKSARRRDSR